MLSVITITFNNFSDLRGTLDSLKGLKIQSAIVNGGSCVETRKFLESFKGLSLSEKDRGISDAFNKGFHLSTGEYIAFLNSGDVLIDPNYYSEALEVFSSNKDIDFVYADISFLDSFAGEIRVRSGKKLPDMPFMHPTLIVRRELVKGIGLFDLEFKIAMDLDFVYRLVRSGAKGHYIPRMVVRMDGAGVSSSKHFTHYLEVFKVIRKNRDYSLASFYYLLKRGIALIMKKIILMIGAGYVIKFYRKTQYGFKKDT